MQQKNQNFKNKLKHWAKQVLKFQIKIKKESKTITDLQRQLKNLQKQIEKVEEGKKVKRMISAKTLFGELIKF